MAIPVTISDEPLVYDTLPALKVRYYKGGDGRSGIYTFGRFYFLKDALALCLNVFEQAPDEKSRAEFALGAGTDDYLRLRVWRDSAELALCGPAGEQVLEAPAPEYIAGGDEQGWYWGAKLLLGAPLLAKAGLSVQPGAAFRAAVCKARDGEEAFGASFDARETPGEPERFTSFVAVGY